VQRTEATAVRFLTPYLHRPSSEVRRKRSHHEPHHRQVRRSRPGFPRCQAGATKQQARHLWSPLHRCICLQGHRRHSVGSPRQSRGCDRMPLSQCLVYLQPRSCQWPIKKAPERSGCLSWSLSRPEMPSGLCRARAQTAARFRLLMSKAPPWQGSLPQGKS
jgi:hypothetical protein